MLSKNYGQKTRGTLRYAQKIRLNNKNRRIKRNPPKFCPYCKEISDSVNILTDKINEIEEVIDNFKNFLKKSTPMEVDNPFEYALYCSGDWDPMDLD